METILAKSPREKDAPRFSETLRGHTEAVFESFRRIFGADETTPTPTSRRWSAFFRMPGKTFTDFYRNGALACLLHDIGKANDGFQEMVCGKRAAQSIYHEHLAGLILHSSPVKAPLSAIPGIDFNIVLSAVIGHHLRAGFDHFGDNIQPDLKYFNLYPAEIARLVNDALYRLNPAGPEPVRPSDFPTSLDYNEDTLYDDFESLKRDLYRYKRGLKKNEEQKRLLTAVRAGLIIADSLGSALFRTGKDMEDWLNVAFGESLSGSYIENKVIEKRIAQITTPDKTFRWNDFQEKTESLPRRALLLAPCGSGKTLAAWRWIAARLEENPAGRVLFLYPTRATATEGFRDYVAWAPESDAALIHSSSAYELETLFDTAGDETLGRSAGDERQGRRYYTDSRLYAFGFWHKRIFAGTVHQFLGFMQHAYRSICLMPLLADAVVVFDEVHSYDPGLFSAFRHFLKHFDIPVLTMTATLPGRRFDDLVNDCGLTPFPESMDDLPDLQEKAEMPRYHVCRSESAEEAEADVTSALEGGKKVLWVVNTVARCQNIARKFQTDTCLCYHSRFKLDDRKNRHKEVVDAFQQDRGPLLAVTTQVCEMSLDLSADLLVSETAPVTAMIQRMGRCNRHANPGEGRIGEVRFYTPQNRFPYSEEDMEGAEAFVDEIDGKTIGQAEAAAAMERLGPRTVEVEKFAAFLEQGPFAEPGHLMEDKGIAGVSAILRADRAEYYRRIKEKKPIDGLLLTAPRKFAVPLPGSRYIHVVEDHHYNSQYGFSPQSMEEII